MKIAIIGGHLSPALAIIEKLDKDDVYYIGRKYTFEGDKALSLEYQEITNLKIPFFSLTTARLQRKFTRHTLTSLAKLPIGFSQSYFLLNKIRPDIILGFGGYLQVPIVMAAHFLKIPVVIHEQTLEAGIANKISSKFAKKICISWESSRKYFPKEKTLLTGSPIKQEIINVKNPPAARLPLRSEASAKGGTKEKNKLPTLYVSGGSSGSHVINVLVENSLEKLLEKCVIIHQTGDAQKYKDFERLYNKKEKLNKVFSQNYTIKKFFNSTEVSKILSKSDFFVGRSGINTVSELIYLEKPAFLIPLPFSQKNEQLKNAEFLKNLGLAEVITQDLLTDNLFTSTIFSMADNVNTYKLREYVLVKNASEKIIKVLKNVSKKKAA